MVMILLRGEVQKRPVRIYFYINYVKDRVAEEDESTRPLKHEFRAQLYSLLQQGYLDDVDPSVLYGDEKSTELPGVLGKATEILKRKGQIYFPSRK